MTIEPFESDERLRDQVDKILEQNAAILRQNEILLKSICSPMVSVGPMPGLNDVVFKPSDLNI